MHSNVHRTRHVAGSLVSNEPLWLRILLISAAYAIIGSLILVPLAYVFIQAFGMNAWCERFVTDLGRLLGVQAVPEEWPGVGATLAELWPTLRKGANDY